MITKRNGVSKHVFFCNQHCRNMVHFSFNGYFKKYLQIVDGTDISELLMENVTKFPMDNLAFDKKNSKDIKDMSIEPLNNFKELLLQGNKSDTLGK